MHELSETTFLNTATAALKDPRLRRNFNRAMTGLMEKRQAMFPDSEEFETLRDAAGDIRRKALARLPELLETLETKCVQNGIQVHWAETVNQANRIVLGIAREAKTKLAVKGKSMVSEEMGLNEFLEQNGIETLESDLGEYIIQVDRETPSHIIMPAIHKNKDQIARLFHEKVDPRNYTESAEEMTATAREVLRHKFHDADLGISGVNFAVAETGTLCLVENEGNGRFSTTLPPVHVAVMGIEKVVETLEDIPPLLTVLTRSATGQAVTTYFNMISGPRKAAEMDGPREVHLVLLDNGRSRIYKDRQLRETLLCIRCGACINHCPVYTRIGGHAYQSVYPGPIGKILTPQMKGIDVAGHLTDASSLCGACVEVCPVKIPITDILLRLRKKRVSTKRSVPWTDLEGGKARLEAFIWKGWQTVLSFPELYRLKTRFLSRTGHLLPGKFPILRRWTESRSKPRFAEKTLHQMVEEAGVDDE